MAKENSGHYVKETAKTGITFGSALAIYDRDKRIGFHLRHFR